MIVFDKKTKILIYHQPIDMRKSIDGLTYLVTGAMQHDPLDKTIYLFRNKSGDKFKAIFWDANGFIMLYKRLEKGRFIFPKTITSDTYEIDVDLFQWLSKGFDFYAIKYQSELKYSQYF